MLQKPLPIVLGTINGPINFGVFALVLSAASYISIEGPPEPIMIPTLVATSLSSKPESFIASFSNVIIGEPDP